MNFAHICPLIAMLATRSASSILVGGASENWNLLAHWENWFQFFSCPESCVKKSLKVRDFNDIWTHVLFTTDQYITVPFQLS